MHSLNWKTLAFALLATLGALLTSSAPPAQSADLRALDGEWTYVEDRTEGRALEQLGPPMSSRFSLRVEDGAVFLVRGHGSGHRDVRVALDGTITEVTEGRRPRAIAARGRTARSRTKSTSSAVRARHPTGSSAGSCASLRTV